MKDTVIILPTFNEAENLRKLLPRLKQYDVDILVVDDSPDSQTADVAESLNVRVLERGLKGRVSALLDGMAVTTHRNVVTMDADLQHPPEVIPHILEALGRSEVVIASRCVDGGSYEDSPLRRRIVSSVARLLALPLAPKVKDRNSGFVAFRRSVVDGAKLPQGFSTLCLGVLVMGSYSAVEEVPYTFAAREEGESKLSHEAILDHLMQLARLYLYKFRILRFMLVGASGTVIGLGSLYALTELVGLYYLTAYPMSFILSVTNNYILNSRWTFKQKRGVAGWVRYAAICVGTLALNVTLMYVLTDMVGLWYMLSAVLVTLLVFLINYAMSRRVVWHAR